MPRWPAAWAAGGKIGDTKRVRLGAGTSRPATFTFGAPGARRRRGRPPARRRAAGAAAGDGVGDGTVPAMPPARPAAHKDAEIKMAVACLMPGSGLSVDLAPALGLGGGDDLLLQVARAPRRSATSPCGTSRAPPVMEVSSAS